MSKCKYYKLCNNYDESSLSCSVDSGWYNEGKGSSCFLKLGEKMKKNTKQELYELKKKSTIIAVGLSLFIPGLGHMYLNRTAIGIFYFILSLVLWLILCGWIVWLIAIFDAYAEAKKQNEILEIELGL